MALFYIEFGKDSSIIVEAPSKDECIAALRQEARFRDDVWWADRWNEESIIELESVRWVMHPLNQNAPNIGIGLHNLKPDYLLRKDGD